MTKLKQVLIQKFEKIISQNNIKTFFNDDDLIENIDILSDIIDEKKNLADNFSTERKRKIFDNMFPSLSLKMLWFASISQDNLEIYKFTCDGLKWKKGGEVIKAIECQEIYFDEFRPPIISNWLINDKDFEASKVAQNLGSSLLYSFEKSTKKDLHQLVNSRLGSTNSAKIYEFLKNTENKDLFNKIMRKQMKNFEIRSNNIILKLSNLENKVKFYEWFYENTEPEKIQHMTDTLRKNGFNHISNYFFQKNLSENLSENISQSKKLKI